MGKFHQFYKVICPRHDDGWVLSFHVLFEFTLVLEMLGVLHRVHTCQGNVREI